MNIVINDSEDINTDVGGQNIAGGLVSEQVIIASRDEEVQQNSPRKPQRVWIGVRAGVLLLTIMVVVLIPTVFFHHDFDAEVVQDKDAGQVCC
jgi:hypothetical protein